MDAPLTPHADVSVGQWVLDSVGPWDWAKGITWLVPPVFEAYARILHPVSGQQLTWHGDEMSGDEQRMRWRDVAAREGTTLHPLAQWQSLIGDHRQPEFRQDGWQYGGPEVGRMDMGELATVAAVLARHTSTPAESFAAVWAGWGELHADRSTAALAWGGSAAPPQPPPRQLHPIITQAWANPRFELRHRESLLFACDVRAFTDTSWAVRSGLGGYSDLYPVLPMAVWPADRSWYLASEIDFDSTIVGGSRELVDELLRLNETDAAEVLEIGPDADLTVSGDRVN